jgi:hypothetical protein
MFKLSDSQTRSEYLLVPPTIGTVMEGPVLEDVLFLRDDMAAMCWAVEKTLQGPLDTPVDGYEAWRLQIQKDPPPPPRHKRQVTDPDIYYLLQTSVPYNWIPMVPIRTASGGLFMRRGVMDRLTPQGPVPIQAEAVVLEPWHPFFVVDQAIPRAGAQVTRRIRRTRWVDGETYVWMARRSRPGRGPGWAGLAYDLIEPMGKRPPEVGP